MNIMRKMWFPKTTTLLSLTEKGIYLHMESKWKRAGRKPFTTQMQEMADGLGVSKSSVKRAVQRLKEAEVISSIQVGAGTHSQSLYTLETYITSDSDAIPNFLEDGSLLLNREDVRYLLGTGLDDKELEAICL